MAFCRFVLSETLELSVLAAAAFLHCLAVKEYVGVY